MFFWKLVQKVCIMLNPASKDFSPNPLPEKPILSRYKTRHRVLPGQNKFKAKNPGNKEKSMN